jgi:hypothetical protein
MFLTQSREVDEVTNRAFVVAGMAGVQGLGSPFQGLGVGVDWETQRVALG